MTELSGASRPMAFMGTKVFTDPTMVTIKIDWSGCRSRARARRRARRGFRQNIRVIYEPSNMITQLPSGDLVMHPATYDALKAEVDRRESELEKRTTAAEIDQARYAGPNGANPFTPHSPAKMFKDTWV